ncbi:MAG: hypothetical protein ACD_39C01844G0001 [uncultured bacterium]|nr:MAG: hypothetical protein ACD_39C01844G0001 [uncultured bacterium]
MNLFDGPVSRKDQIEKGGVDFNRFFRNYEFNAQYAIFESFTNGAS